MKKHLIPVVVLASLLASCNGGGSGKWEASKAFGDKELDYCLLIGQIDHNDSAARTAGIRDALKTRAATKTTNANTENPVDGKLSLNGNEYTVKEIEHGEQKATGGATWDQQTATNTTEGWFNKHGDKIDFIVSNNDGMAEGAIAAASYVEGTPIFGYDSNESTLQFIKQGKIMGTVNQNASAQVGGFLMLARNLIDGSAKPTEEGFTTESTKGYGKLSSAFTYKDTDRSFLVDNFAITASNVDKYLGKKAADLVDANVRKGTTDKKEVFLNFYSASDTFLNSNIRPLIDNYKDKFNFDINIQSGDGNTESTVLDKINRKFDAYIINVIKTTATISYLNQIASLEGGKVNKPVIFFNRQATKEDGTVDQQVMKDDRFTKGIYYVGFDAVQGGQVQGKMIVDWLSAQEKTAK